MLLLALIIIDGVIRLEVLNTCVMAGTGLTHEQAEQGLMKNHWRWQAIVRDEEGTHLGITFSFDPDDSSSVRSDVAQYAGSSRACSNSGRTATALAPTRAKATSLRLAARATMAILSSSAPSGAKASLSRSATRLTALRPVVMAQRFSALLQGSPPSPVSLWGVGLNPESLTSRSWTAKAPRCLRRV